MKQLYFHGEDVTPTPAQDALFHVIPVPLEKTVSYGAGTNKGPREILKASCQLELFDGQSIPASHGIHTTAPILCDGDHQEILLSLEKKVRESVIGNAIPVVLGGEHSLTSAAIKALKSKYHDFGVVQFDAHADLRESYEGTKYSHASVMRRIVEEDVPIYQLGTRSYCLAEHEFRTTNDIWYKDAETIWQEGAENIRLPKECPDKVYITFDVDCFDSSIMPATGTPVPGGLNWYQVIWLLKTILADKVCVGFDLVELAPQKKLHGASFATAQLAYNIMGYIVRSQVNQDFYNI